MKPRKARLPKNSLYQPRDYGTLQSLASSLKTGSPGKIFNLHGRRPIVLTFVTIGCKTLSKHLTDTYYRGSAGGAAINQNSCGRQRLPTEPWKDDLIPRSSLFLQIKTQGNQERNPIWICLPPRRGRCNLPVLGGGSHRWAHQVEAVLCYRL